jgi:hypothetical protein
MQRIILTALGGILLLVQGIVQNFWPTGLLTIIGFAGIPGNLDRWWGLVSHLVAWMPAIAGFTLIGVANRDSLARTTVGKWISENFTRSIPLQDATWRAYERFATTAYGRMAENDNPSDPEGIRRWFAWHIWQRVPIYGARHPNKKIQRIPAELQGRSYFDGPANALKIRGENTVYQDLRVRRADFEQYIRQIDELLADNPSLNI